MIKIIVIEKHKLIRQSLIKAIEQIHGLKIINSGGNGLEAIELLKKHKADIVLLDINLPVLNGLQTLKKIRESEINTKVIIITAYPNKSDIIKSMKFGASGFITKNTDFTNFVKIIKRVYNGESYLEPSIIKLLNKKSTTNIENITEDKGLSKIDLLSPREYEILELISLGHSNEEIGNITFISEKTVKNHITNIYSKIKVKNRTEAVIFCYENKIREIGAY